MKIRCYVCKQYLPTTSFNRNAAAKSGYCNRCRVCHKAYRIAAYNKRKSEDWASFAEERRWINLLQNYKISRGEYEKLLEEQKGACAICRRKPYGKHKYLYVDHDHDTGKVRGLLCNGCNTGLGGFREKPLHFRRAITYLKRFR